MRRLIFTLLYDSGHFMLSRNFRLQKVGSVKWLFDNYDFAAVSHGLDELMMLDVSRGERGTRAFAEHIRQIAASCFIPVTAGGGIKSFHIANQYLHHGADKLLLNTAFSTDPRLCYSLAREFGEQCIVAGIDYRNRTDGRRVILSGSGAREIPGEMPNWVDHVRSAGAGEILFQSTGRDGTGMGLDLDLFEELPSDLEAPCILMGGIGKAQHILAGLRHPRVDAIATANLYNFIGAAFLDVRSHLREAGVELPQWSGDYSTLKGMFLVKAGSKALQG